MDKISVGLVGFGFSGSTFHAPIIQTIEELLIQKVVSSQPEKVKRHLPDAEVVNNLEILLNDPAIQLVVITTPNETHYHYAKAALEAGKHVVVEKPFVIHAAQADELIKIASEKQLLLSVYQNRRWDNDFLTIKKCINSNLLGKIHTYEAHFDRYRPEVRDRWREQDLPGSGILYDLGSHLVDQALHLFGLPQKVYADLLQQRPGAKIHDYFHLILGYESGLRVILHGGCIVRNPGPRFEIHGTLGSLIKPGLDSQEEMLKQGAKPGDPRWGEDLPEHFATLVASVNGLELNSIVPSITGSYESYYQEVASAILSGTANPVPADEARWTIRIIEAAIQSNKEQRVISL